MEKIIFLCVFVSLSVFAKIETRVQPTSVTVGETFRVIYSADGQKSNALPDFSSLEKDFNVVGTNKSSQLTVINGQVSSSTKWIVSLIAKRKGNTTLPVIHFGNDSSEAVTIHVVAMKKNYANEAGEKDVFVDVSVDKKNVYVQSQIIYKAKLYYAKRLSSGDFQAPLAKNALLIQMGKGSSYQERINNRVYQVLEQNYAVFPEKSGDFEIKPPIFKGIIENSNYRRIDQILMDVQKPITLSAETINIDVKPIPQNFKGEQWLPAKALKMTDRYSGSIKKIKVGSPITRTISIQAVGLTAAQLPNLKFEGQDNFNVYPEKAQNQNGMRGDNLVGQKVINVVYMPTKSGELTIPPITLSWWNTVTNKREVSRLAERQFYLKGSTTKKSDNAIYPMKQSGTVKTTKNLSALPHKPKAKASIIGERLPWLLVFLLLGSWVIYILFKYRPKKELLNQMRPQDEGKSTLLVKKSLKKACMDNDAKKARELILLWANKRFDKDFYDLSQLTDFLQNEAFSKAISELQSALYGNSENLWQGQSLWAAWLALTKLTEKTKNKKQSGLSPLNPSMK